MGQVCEERVDENILFVDRDYYLSNQETLEKQAERGKKVVVFIDKPLNVLGENIIFSVHILEEEVRANNFVARSEASKYTKEFNEMAFQNFYNAEKDYQDLTAWFKFEWKDAEEILYTFEDSDDPKYALHKKRKLIMAEKAYGKGRIILSTLSALNGCIGYNPVLDKLFVNLIEM